VTARRRRRGPGAPRIPGRGPSRSRPVALTGTPGVGKSAVARRLRSRWTVLEVADLALAVGAGRRLGRAGVEVDLRRLRAACRPRAALAGVDVLVGHLAHLLPVRQAIVLRCHPLELGRRLRAARRGTAADRRANVVGEAVDLVLVEALREGLPVAEVDTTGRTPSAVARDVERRLRHTGSPRSGTVDWLSDPAVTEHLLDGAV
jgi:adenylate kinase